MSSDISHVKLDEFKNQSLNQVILASGIIKLTEGGYRMYRTTEVLKHLLSTDCNPCFGVSNISGKVITTCD